MQDYGYRPRNRSVQNLSGKIPRNVLLVEFSQVRGVILKASRALI